jgi:hypothetical protein
LKVHTTYSVGSGDQRHLYRCQTCNAYFSETKNTPLEGLRKPLSFIISVLNALNEGLGINATARTFGTTKRRKMSCYRRRTNTYAKEKASLQTRLDAYWVLHNFVRVHFTTKQVPAVALGILNMGLSLAELFKIQFMTPKIATE